MEIQKEREAFEKYCFEVFLMSPSDGHFDRELQDPEFYESVDTHRLWKLWQAKAQAVPDGFVLMPIKPTTTMVDAVANEHEGEAFLPYSLYDAYVKQAMIEAREQGNG